MFGLRSSFAMEGLAVEQLAILRMRASWERLRLDVVSRGGVGGVIEQVSARGEANAALR